MAEIGGEFHWDSSWICPREGWSLPNNAQLYATGRGALLSLLRHGMEARGWTRLFLPDYLCHEVVEAARRSGIEVAPYVDGPGRPAIPPLPDGLGVGDALLAVNWFGLRGPKGFDLDIASLDVIEDHTHDSWSLAANRSQAAYCLASLRKTLPIPGGAMLWSPTGLEVPEPEPRCAADRLATDQKLEAMLLKAAHLAGVVGLKPTYRRLQRLGEARLAQTVCAASDWTEAAVRCLPVMRWRDARARNAVGLTGLALPWVATPADGCAPFCVPLVCEDRNQRGFLRAWLAQREVWATVLWPPHDSWPQCGASADFADRILCLPCDWRYGAEDMDRMRMMLAEGIERWTKTKPGRG